MISIHYWVVMRLEMPSEIEVDNFIKVFFNFLLLSLLLPLLLSFGLTHWHRFLIKIVLPHEVQSVHHNLVNYLFWRFLLNLFSNSLLLACLHLSGVSINRDRIGVVIVWVFNHDLLVLDFTYPGGLLLHLSLLLCHNSWCLLLEHLFRRIFLPFVCLGTEHDSFDWSLFSYLKLLWGFSHESLTLSDVFFFFKFIDSV